MGGGGSLIISYIKALQTMVHTTFVSGRAIPEDATYSNYLQYAQSGQDRFHYGPRRPLYSVFQHVIFLCYSVPDNETYLSRSCIWTNPEVYVIDSSECLHDWLQFFFGLSRGERTLYDTDDKAASQAISQKKTMLSVLATRGRLPKQSMRVLTQQYNCVAWEVREQTTWKNMFHGKDRDTFEDVCRENDVIPSHEKQAELKRLLASTKHARLILNTDKLVVHTVLCCGYSQSI